MSGYLISKGGGKGGEFTPPADGWVQILAIGDHPNAEAGIIQHVDSESLSAIVADFKSQASADNWPGMLVDFDHFSHSKDHPTGAAAWIDEIEERDGGELWAHWRLTNTGAKAVNGGDYRLTSSVLGGFTKYDGAPSTKHLRPTKLLRVALTNDPNIKNMAPVSNRADGTTTTTKETDMADTTMNHKALLIELLNLTEGASDEDIQKAIDLLKADAEADAGPNPDGDGDEDTHPAAVENRSELERLSGQIIALNREVAEARAEQFFPLVGENKEAREALIEIIATNRAAALGVFGAIKARPAVVKSRASTTDVRAPFKPAFNRSVQPTPGGDKSQLNGDEVAKQCRIKAQEIFAANRASGMTWGQAWEQGEASVLGSNGAAK